MAFALSRELRVAREIYRAELSGLDGVTIRELCALLEPQGIVREQEVFDALDVLFDRGMVKSVRVSRHDGRFEGFTIAGEARDFLRHVMSL